MADGCDAHGGAGGTLKRSTLKRSTWRAPLPVPEQGDIATKIRQL
jgi:hypothetical protein